MFKCSVVECRLEVCLVFMLVCETIQIITPLNTYPANANQTLSLNPRPLLSGYSKNNSSSNFQSSWLNLTPLTWRLWWAPNNASRWLIEFNSAFKGLNDDFLSFYTMIVGGHERFVGTCYLHLESERIMSWRRLRWLCKQMGWSYGIWPIKTARFKSYFPFIWFWLPLFLQLAYIMTRII